MSDAVTSFAPVSARTGAPIRLAMQRLWLTGEVLPAGARLFIQHVFESSEKRRLEVIYAFPLPRDAALRRFRIVGEGFEAESELRETAEAVRAYEEGIADGSLSVLARQYRDGIVNLTVGNMRPGEKVTVELEILAGIDLRDDGFRFRFPFTLAPAYHSKMRAAVVDEEGEIELPAAAFGDVMLPHFREDTSSLHEVGFDLAVAHELQLIEIGSTSHAICVRQQGSQARVGLAPAKDVPNRDLILDARFEESRALAFAGPDATGKRSFAVVVPSTEFAPAAAEPRRMVMLLDRSGSMQGEPLAQARKAIEACLGALSEEDSFLLMAFDNELERMDSALIPATRQQRDLARDFLNGIEARGGTELAAGVREAARVLGTGGDILVITDGQVFGTEDILEEARRTGIRLSCLGIGSASQDRFLALLARETGGVARFVSPRERVDRAAVDLFASIGHPLATDLEATGVEPPPPRFVFAGSPVVLFGQEEAGGAGVVELRSSGGIRSFALPRGEAATGETLRLLRGARLITDWESRYVTGDSLPPVDKRKRSRVATRLQELSKAYGLASREMSLVAVVRRAGDRAGELPETRVVPVGVPQDAEFSSYFPPRPSRLPDRVLGAGIRFAVTDVGALPAAPLMEVAERRRPVAPAPPRECEDDLIGVAAMLEPDGGMPGGSRTVRAGRSAAAILAFVADGHTLNAGTFRLHVRRLVEFLKSVTTASEREARVIATAIGAASSGHASAGEWLALAMDKRTTLGRVQVELERRALV